MVNMLNHILRGTRLVVVKNYMWDMFFSFMLVKYVNVVKRELIEKE